MTWYVDDLNGGPMRHARLKRLEAMAALDRGVKKPLSKTKPRKGRPAKTKKRPPT